MRLMVEIDGENVPLDKCDWAMLRACGCVRQIMHAVSAGETFADPIAAWHDFLSWETPRKRDRERLIRKEIEAGRKVVLMRIDDAVDALWKVCLHKKADW